MKAYVIGLGLIPSSFESAIKVYNQLKDYGLETYFHEGTYGDKVERIFAQERRVLHHTSFKGNPVDDEYRQSSMRLGVMGCFHSHWRLWQRCVELNEPILIFEDDVIFERGWMPVEWSDVLLVATGKSVYQDPWYAEKLYNPSGEPAAVGFKGKVMPGAVGYGLTPQGAKKLTEFYAKCFLPADNAMNMGVVDLQCHNYLMGRAAISEDGKASLTKSQMWKKLKNPRARKHSASKTQAE
jgi:GR25 family glycosyltransferase involved in LPS biosynthesis